MNNSGGLSLGCIKIVVWSLRAQIFAVASNILGWRTFVVVSLFAIFYILILWLIVNNLNLSPKIVLPDTCDLPKKRSSHIYMYINLHGLI